MYKNSLIFIIVVNSLIIASAGSYCTYYDKTNNLYYDLSDLLNPSDDYRVFSQLEKRTYIFNFCEFTMKDLPCGRQGKTFMYREKRNSNGDLKDC